MLPQSAILILAPILVGRDAELHRLLGGLNLVLGLADPANPLTPFSAFERLRCYLATLGVLGGLEGV